MKQMIRFLLWGVVFSYLNAGFILFPSKDKRIEELFNKNLRIIETACSPSQYRKTNIFTTLIVKDLPDAIAYCHKKANGFVIAFDTAYLERILSDLEKDQVMMHELVHCVFDEEHFSDPKHFMAEFFEEIPKETYEIQVEEYLKQKCQK